MAEATPQPATTPIPLTDWLWHFVGTETDPVAALAKSLKTGTLFGARNRFSPVGSVSFVERPLPEPLRLRELHDEQQHPRSSCYGLGFSKRWVSARGGLPAIYHPVTRRHEIPPELSWRHVTYTSAEIRDLSSQQEWRVPAKKLLFDAGDEPIVIVGDRSALPLIKSVWDNDGKTIVLTHTVLCQAYYPRDLTLRIRSD